MMEKLLSGLGSAALALPRTMLWLVVWLALTITSGSHALVSAVLIGVFRTVGLMLALLLASLVPFLRWLRRLLPHADLHTSSRRRFSRIDLAEGMGIVRKGEEVSPLVTTSYSRRRGERELEFPQRLGRWSGEEVQERAEALLPYLHAETVRVIDTGKNWRVIWSATAATDATDEVRDYPINNTTGTVDDVPIGIRPDGSVFRWPVMGMHTLLVGSSGSGKGSFLWSYVLGLMPSIDAGLTKLYGIDLKGGVEFNVGAGAFEKIAMDKDDVKALLDEFKNALDRRLVVMRETGSRKHVPTPEEPLLVLMIDEAGMLTFGFNSKESSELMAMMRDILSRGRAAGVVVFAAMQDPRKEAFPVRDLFTLNVGLRLKTRTETALVMDDAAWEAGAKCELLPTDRPGVGYCVAREGIDAGRVQKFRAFWVDDDTIRGATIRKPAPAAVEPQHFETDDERAERLRQLGPAIGYDEIEGRFIHASTTDVEDNLS